MSWTIILITADGTTRRITGDLQSEAQALMMAREASKKDPGVVYEVFEGSVTRMRLRGGEPISEPKLP